MKRPSETAAEAKPKASKVATFDEPEARLNVTLPESLHKKVKMRALQDDVTIREFIIKLLADAGVK
jgi:ATP-dependent Clp protease adapter protein ClpS